MRQRCRPLVSILFLAFASACVFAQVDTATITGRVSDSTGAVVPNVQVTVISTNTNFRFVATTNNEGLYRVQSLQPGAYQLTFEAQGFKKVIRDGLTLRVGDVVPVDIALEVGATTESVQVSAINTLLETETSSLGTVTEGTTLYNLPLYQRYITSTMEIVPGLTFQTQGGTSGLSAFTVNGQRNTGTAVFEDGVFGNDPLGSTSVIKPIQNSVEEVKVLTGTLPAEYGHSASGIITTVKKSGTNQFHGSAADYGRTRIMTHRQYFNFYTLVAAAARQPQWRSRMVHAARCKRRRTDRHSEALQRPQQDLLLLRLSEADRKEDPGVHQPDANARHAERRLHIWRRRTASLRPLHHAPECRTAPGPAIPSRLPSFQGAGSTR